MKKPDQKAMKTGFKYGLSAGLRVVRGFMDKVDWDHELGAACGGNKIHPSIKDLKANHKCLDQCGIVEVEVRLKRVVRESDFAKTSKSQLREELNCGKLA